MASAHQHSAGGGKRSKFLNRLFPWRASSSRDSQQSSSSGGSRLMSQVGLVRESMPVGGGQFASIGSVRRTSPVDLNLGVAAAEPVELGPSPPQLPPPPFDLDYAVPRSRRSVSRRRTAEPSPPPAPPRTVGPTPEQMDKEELGALRHLAIELHEALRLSEEENVLLKAKLQTLDDWGLMNGQQQQPAKSQTTKLDQLIEDLRDIAGSSSQTPSPYTSPYVHRKNMRDLGRILQQRQMELRRLTQELQQTQTELLFTQVELDAVRRCLHRLDQRLLLAEEELELARQGLLQASINKQRLMQELQTTRGLLMRCWSRVRVLEQQQQEQQQQGGQLAS